jgi:hypothetical protein
VAIVLVAAVAVLLGFFDVPSRNAWLAAMIVSSAFALWLFRGGSEGPVIGRACAAAVVADLALNLSFAPALLRYQAGSEAARFINSLPPRETGTVDVTSSAFDFYLRPAAAFWDVSSIPAQPGSPVYVYMPEGDLARLPGAGLEAQVLARFASFHVSMPRGPFLNARTRASALSTMVVAEVTRAKNGLPANVRTR